MPAKIKDEDKLEGLADIVDLSSYPKEVADELCFVKGNVDQIHRMFDEKCGTKKELEKQLNFMIMHAISVGSRLQKDRDYQYIEKISNGVEKLNAKARTMVVVTTDLIDLTDEYKVPISKVARALKTSVTRLRMMK